MTVRFLLIELCVPADLINFDCFSALVTNKTAHSKADGRRNCCCYIFVGAKPLLNPYLRRGGASGVLRVWE